ncbi:MAG: hypothetical protein J4G05_06045 [Chlorobi bacterium]|nr:hypothetical protein [Chlorobiota bacterium]
MKREFFLPILFAAICSPFLTNSTGCKEGCVGVDCNPAPPGLTITVNDTMLVEILVLRVDTVTQDTIMEADDTILVFPTSEATVTLHPVVNDLFQAPVASLESMGSDTSYVLADLFGLSDIEYGVIATRGVRSDTLSGLSISTVEGCCGYSVIGRYVIELPEEE